MLQQNSHFLRQKKAEKILLNNFVMIYSLVNIINLKQQKKTKSHV
jgi:hypothetical protein